MHGEMQMVLASRPLPRAAEKLLRAIGASRDLDVIAGAMAHLVASDDWLPADLRMASPDSYRREPLFESEAGDFAMGCFVWGPGQATPIHDHNAWGVVGVLTGRLKAENFVLNDQGVLSSCGGAILRAGQTTIVDPRVGDIHRVGSVDGLAISIHIYGAGLARACKNFYRDEPLVMAAE